MLRVTKLTDYATVVLTALAARPGARAQRRRPGRARAAWKPPTVSKVLKPLAQAGLVDGFRGANGGYRLARAADAISLIEIVEAMEGPLGMTECSVHARPLRHRALTAACAPTGAASTTWSPTRCAASRWRRCCAARRRAARRARAHRRCASPR